MHSLVLFLYQLVTLLGIPSDIIISNTKDHRQVQLSLLVLSMAFCVSYTPADIIVSDVLETTAAASSSFNSTVLCIS